MSESGPAPPRRRFSDRSFRDALSSFPTGVTIVTAQASDGNPVGMTASSFNSVSTDPPLVLWSVSKKALGAPAFKAAEHFAIHVLTAEQSELSNGFANSGTDKFAAADYMLDDNGVPILSGVAARFDCRTWAVYEGGDHWIIVGEVGAIQSDNTDSLVFSGGAYARLAPLSPRSLALPQKNLDGGSLKEVMVYFISRASEKISARFYEAVRDYGLSIAEWRVLSCLKGQAAMTIDELAEATLVEVEALRDVTADLSEEGFCAITQRGDEQMVEETPQGSDRVAHLFALADDYEAQLLRGLSEDATVSFKQSLAHVAQNAEKL